MKKTLATLLLAFAFVIPIGALGATTALAAHPAAVAHAKAAAGCPNYSNGCQTVPPSGTVTFSCGGANFSGSATAGSTVTCSQVSLLATLACSSETATSVSISGSGLDLTVPGASIYMFNSSTGQSTLVSAITSSGEYTIVWGSCASTTTTTLPTTGGAQPAGPSTPVLPIGLGILLVLAGAAFTVRNRITQV